VTDASLPTDLAAPPTAPAPPPSQAGWKQSVAVAIIMVAAALLGIAYTSVGGPGESGRGPRIITVWLSLVPVYFAACVWYGWAAAPIRWRMVVAQALHWLAFLGAMYVVLLPDVRGVLNDNAVGLTLLTLLATGTFVAGVHAWSGVICAVGLLLALTIPAIAWLEQSVLLILVVIAGLVCAGVAGFMAWRRLVATRSG
jgi:hypothetical protein